MKSKLLTIIGVAVLALATTTVQAQFITSRSQPDKGLFRASGVSWWESIITFIQGVGTNKQVSLSLCPTYAAGLKTADGRKAEWGAEAMLGYPIASSHLLIQGGLTYLANEFYSGEVTLTPNADVQLFGKTATIYARSGTLIPVTETTQNGEVGMIVGAGAMMTVWKPSANTALSLFAQYDRITPILNVNRYSGGISFNVAF